MTNENKVRVAIVDDQMIARGYFESAVRATAGYCVVASFGSAEAACAYCACNEVDLVLIDVVLRHGMDGIDAAREIKAASPSTKVVAVTSMPEASFIDRARQAGVESFWYKEYADRPLEDVLDATMRGESVYPQKAPPVRLGKALSATITSQELAVLREMASGASNAQIASSLCLSIHTVRTHVRHLLAKTGFETRTQLAVNAVLCGLVVVHDE